MIPEKYQCFDCEQIVEGIQAFTHQQECNVVKLITGVIFEDFPNDGRGE